MTRAEKIVEGLLEEAADAVPPAHHVVQLAQAEVSRDFLEYLKSVENPSRVGYDRRRNRWFPHKDPSGGFSIGYGHHFQKPDLAAHYRKVGMSNDEVEKLLRSDVQRARVRVREYIRNRYGVDVRLSSQQEQMLIDYVFNTGGLEKFPNMVDAILRNDQKRMGAEYRRFANIGGSKTELTDRNSRFASRFFPPAK